MGRIDLASSQARRRTWLLSQALFRVPSVAILSNRGRPISSTALTLESRDIAAVVTTGYALDDRGVRVRVPVGAFPATYRIPEVLSPELKRPRREADHTSNSFRGQEHMELYNHSPYAFMAWCLIISAANLYLYLLRLTSGDGGRGSLRNVR
jgi:hypothetical protein